MIVTPDVQATRIIQVIIHRTDETSFYWPISLSNTIHCENTDVVDGVRLEVWDSVSLALTLRMGFSLVHVIHLVWLLREGDVDVVEDDL